MLAETRLLNDTARGSCGDVDYSHIPLQGGARLHLSRGSGVPRGMANRRQGKEGLSNPVVTSQFLFVGGISGYVLVHVDYGHIYVTCHGQSTSNDALIGSLVLVLCARVGTSRGSSNSQLCTATIKYSYRSIQDFLPGKTSPILSLGFRSQV